MSEQAQRKPGLPVAPEVLIRICKIYALRLEQGLTTRENAILTIWTAQDGKTDQDWTNAESLLDQWRKVAFERGEKVRAEIFRALKYPIRERAIPERLLEIAGEINRANRNMLAEDQVGSTVIEAIRRFGPRPQRKGRGR